MFWKVKKLEKFKSEGIQGFGSNYFQWREMDQNLVGRAVPLELSNRISNSKHRVHEHFLLYETTSSRILG